MFSSWLLYLVSFSLLGTFLLELKCTTDGLQYSSAMIVVSTLAVVEEVVATMGALLYFQDYKYFSATQGVVFALGKVVGVISVVVMATLRLRNEHPRVTTQIVLAAPIDTARMVVFEFNEASGRSESGGAPELTSTSSVAHNVVEPANMAISRNRSPSANGGGVTSPSHASCARSHAQAPASAAWRARRRAPPGTCRGGTRPTAPT